MDTIRPQPGPQEEFLQSSADIVIYGGAARAGKSYALLMEALRHCNNRRASAIFFRRTYPQIMMKGGAWSEAHELYVPLGAKLFLSPHPRAVFPSGFEVSFSHLQHETNVSAYQGSKLPLLLFDEITHFTEHQFWYLNSRNTGTCGFDPYIRASCNPVPAMDPVGGWVNRLVEWWIDQETGYAIPERAGVPRWFYRVNEELKWYDSVEEAKADNPELSEEAEPRSFTFIPGKLSDNPAQIKADPGYRARLLSLPKVDRERLLDGNWNITESPGTLFQGGWFTEYLDSIPVGADVTKAVRFWDEAASDKKGADYTVGCLMLKRGTQRIVADIRRGQWTPEQRIKQQKAAAEFDEGLFGKHRCGLIIEREGGASGLTAAAFIGEQLARFAPQFRKPDSNKITRAKPYSAFVERGAVALVRGRWNAPYIQELENFPSKWNDDQIDASSGAFNALMGNDKPSTGVVFSSNR